MNAVDLAKLFTRRAELMAEIKAVDEQITEEVLLAGESQKIAGVKATYYAESIEYDYEAAAKELKDTRLAYSQIVDDCSDVKKTTRWSEVCARLGIDRSTIPFVVKPARVVIK